MTEKEAIERLKDYFRIRDDGRPTPYLDEAVSMAINALEKQMSNGWIKCEDRLPQRKDSNQWVACNVCILRTHYPTSTYDICDAPYDETIVTSAKYDTVQKIWHLDWDEQLNALINIEDSSLNGDYVIAWQPLPEPFTD